MSISFLSSNCILKEYIKVEVNHFTNKNQADLECFLFLNETGNLEISVEIQFFMAYLEMNNIHK